MPSELGTGKSPGAGSVRKLRFTPVVIEVAGDVRPKRRYDSKEANDGAKARSLMPRTLNKSGS
jgi:hypothetical protein